MFIYSFPPSKKHLIQHIVLQGDYITFYHNKPEDDDSPEFTAIYKKLNMQSVRQEDVVHDLLHNSFDPRLKAGEDAEVHAHGKFNNSSLENLKRVCYFLRDYQQAVNERSDDKKEFISSLPELPPGEKHPDFVNQMIEHYDTEMPFIPEEEIELLLQEYRRYLQTASFLKDAEHLSSYMMQLAPHRQKIAYNEYVYNEEISPSLRGRLPNAEERTFLNYFNQLGELRLALLAFHYEMDDSKKLSLRDQAFTLYAEIIQNPLSKQHPIDMKGYTWLISYQSAKAKITQQCQAYLDHLMVRKTQWDEVAHLEVAQLNYPGLYLTQQKYEKIQAIKAQLDEIADPETALKTFTDAFYDPHTKKPLALLSQHADSVEKRLLIGICVILTGIIPGVIALMCHSYFGEKHSFAFWKSHGEVFTDNVMETFTPPSFAN